MAPLISGPRRRAAIASAADRLMPRVRVRALERAWAVTEPTGRVTVCRTFDDLLTVLHGRGVPRAVSRHHLLAAAASVADTAAHSP